MSKKIISDTIIFEGQVLTVTLSDISPSGFDGKKYRIDILDAGKSPILDEREEVEITGTAIAMMSYGETDLYNYLIQFRNELPPVISSSNVNFFHYPEWDRDFKLYQVGLLIKTFFKTWVDVPLDPNYIRNSIKIEFFEILSILEFYENSGVVKGLELGSASVIAEKKWPNILNAILDELKPVEKIDESEIPIVPEPITIKTETVDPQVITSDAVVTDKCQVIMNDESLCNRDIVEEGLCICHVNNPNKDSDEFDREIKSILKKGGGFDFTEFVFYTGFKFPKQNAYLQKIIFDRCTFYTILDLKNRQFYQDVKIIECIFSEGLNLSKSIFKQDVEIDFNKSFNLSFRFASFHSNLFFSKNLRELEKFGNTDFRDVIFKNPEQVFFRDIFLPNLLFEGTDITTINIIGFFVPYNYTFINKVEREDKKFLWFKKFIRCMPWVRDFHYYPNDELKESFPYKLGDELKLEDNLKSLVYKKSISSRILSVAECYQRLQKNMLNVRNYSVSGYFHIREMELQRLKLGFLGRSLSSYSIYKYFSYYGERILRPICALGFMLIIIPIITMLFMGHNEYVMTGEFKDIDNAIYGWLNEFTYNLENIFYLKNSIFEHKCRPSNLWKLLFIFEKFISVIIVSFIVVGFRRKFKRY